MNDSPSHITDLEPPGICATCHRRRGHDVTCSAYDPEWQALLERRCPSCGAQPGQLCTTVAGVEMTTLVHPSRGKTRRGS